MRNTHIHLATMALIYTIPDIGTGTWVDTMKDDSVFKVTVQSVQTPRGVCWEAILLRHLKDRQDEPFEKFVVRSQYREDWLDGYFLGETGIFKVKQAVYVGRNAGVAV